MTTAIATRNYSPRLYLLLLVLVALMMWAAPGLADVGKEMSHAVERHGLSDVERIHKCLDDNGPTQTWFNPSTSHWAQVCGLDETGRSWGVQIVRQIDGLFEEVTAFPSWDTWLDDLERYLVNRGYMQVP